MSSIWNYRRYQDYQWFRLLALTLLSVAVLYISSHYLLDHFKKQQSWGYEYSRLDQKQMQQINRIYFDSALPKAKEVSSSNNTSDNKEQQSSTITSDKNKSADSDQTKKQVVPKDGSEKNKPTTAGHEEIDSSSLLKIPASIRVIEYLNNEFNSKIDTSQMQMINHYLSIAKPMEATNFLADVRLRVISYFWLTGPAVYFEIIFWTIFGVLAYLLFNIGIVLQNSTTSPANPRSVFDNSEIPNQVAKILYAPLCTLVIVLGYNFFSNQNIVDISSSKGVIVFAFIGGFYSNRLIAFLDRLKEVLLPISGTSDLPLNKNQPSLVPVKNASINLQVDKSDWPTELTTNFSESELNSAVVILKTQNVGSPIYGTSSGSPLPIKFIFSDIRPGIYNAGATWNKTIGTNTYSLKADNLITISESSFTFSLTLKLVKKDPEI